MFTFLHLSCLCLGLSTLCSRFWVLLSLFCLMFFLVFVLCGPLVLPCSCSCSCSCSSFKHGLLYSSASSYSTVLLLAVLCFLFLFFPCGHGAGHQLRPRGAVAAAEVVPVPPLAHVVPLKDGLPAHELPLQHEVGLACHKRRGILR